MASLAEMERELTVERTRPGSNQQGSHDSTVDAAKQLLGSGAAPRVVAADRGLSFVTLYRWFPGNERL